MSSQSTIRAVLADPAAAERLVIREVEPPEPAPNESLVRVAAVSLNRGEVKMAQYADAPIRIGWDLAGTVERAASDGSGPPVGARVVGLLRAGAWAEVAAVPTGFLAELPAGVGFVQAATLPVAGLTALYALARGGSLLGRRVLVTGASGGVGHLAVQLARLSGADAVGLVRRAEHAQIVRDAGAREVVVGEDASGAAPFGPYHLIVESVGGDTLATALAQLAPGGTCVTLGAAETSAATIDLPRFFLTGGASLYGFYLFPELAREPASDGLVRLAGLVAAGRLAPHIAVEAPWTQIGEVARGLLDRAFVGKAVLHVGG